MSQENAFCSVCDHKIVPGVACDGQPEECPYHKEHPAKHHRTSAFAVTVDSMTGESATDAVRSID